MTTQPLRIALIGSVQSSEATLRALLRHDLHVVGVLGLRRSLHDNVSGYRDLEPVARSAGIAYESFASLREPHLADTLAQWAPDLVFAVGLSQIVRDPLLSIPPMGYVGFHPTELPRGRGRAPIAWLTIDGGTGAATFFRIDAGTDSGPILVQEPFAIAPGAYAEDVERQILIAMDAALDALLPELAERLSAAKPQREELATYNGRRAPSDGLMDWNRPAGELAALVRASSHPHPGAFTYYQGNKLTVWRASVARDARHRGVVGRVVDAGEAGLVVQTGDVLLVVEEWAMDGDPLVAPAVGSLLGYRPELEIHKLWERIRALEAQLATAQISTSNS